MKIQQTKRKFYNKWLYKITLRIVGVTQFRVKSLWEIIEFSKNAKLVELATALEQLNDEDRAVRVEHNQIDVYTNDRAFFEKIIDQFKSELIHCFAPALGSETVLDQKRTIISSKLPHDKYRYKVFLQPHKVSSIEDKIRWVNWLDTQSDRVLISESVKTWFIKTNWNWDRRYVYVEDEQTLLMIKMKNPEAVGSVYSYAVLDK
jgi:hypothetical protein